MYLFAVEFAADSEGIVRFTERYLYECNGFFAMADSRLVDGVVRYPEVRVWQRRDRLGHVGWHGYDPTTGDYVCFGTEDEIRSWIEQRYYSKGW